MAFGPIKNFAEKGSGPIFLEKKKEIRNIHKMYTTVYDVYLIHFWTFWALHLFEYTFSAISPIFPM